MTDQRHQRRPQPQPQTTSAFADAAAFLERIGAAGFGEGVYEAREEAEDEQQQQRGRQQRMGRQRRPSESLGRRLRNFLMRPRRRQSASDAATAVTGDAESASSSELQDYVYTRWVFHRRWCGSPERSLSHDHLRCAAAAVAEVPESSARISSDDAAGLARSSGPASASRRTNGASAMTKSASARMVRFRCPYDSSGSEQDSTLVSPYLTSAFPCLPLPPGGSVSSGYSSDLDTPPAVVAAAAAAAAASQHWVTREEDIDCLLLRRQPPSAGCSAAAAAAVNSAVPVGEDDDFDLADLDVSAFFAEPPTGSARTAGRISGGDCGFRTLPLPPAPPPLPPRCHWNSQNLADVGARRTAVTPYYDPVADEIDRLVGEVVRLGGASWGRQRPPRA